MGIVCNRCVFKSGDRVDRFTVERMLGAGTFGCVYKVTDPTGHVFALKLLKMWEVSQVEREQLSLRFDREFETAQIKSHYLIHSYEKGIVEGNPYFTMDFCPNGDLLDASRHGNIDLGKVGREVLYGLRDLHKHGKVHRDLKPENVLILHDGTAILTDFGISGDQNKRLTERGITGVPRQIFGTYVYMPPEQVSPKRGNATVLPTTDIFSFGVMMFQLLTGHLPFGSDLNDQSSEKDFVKYIENGRKGRWSRDILQRSAAEWANVIDGCLKPNYKERLQSVDEVLQLMPHSGEAAKSEYISSTSAIHNEGQKTLLRVMQGEENGRIYKLNDLITRQRRILRIGRQCDEAYNEVQLLERETAFISRCHATLEYDEESMQWYIKDGQWRNDCAIAKRSQNMFPCKVCTAFCSEPYPPKFRWLPSTNGTHVNSTEVDSNGIRLSPGDIITIGDSKLRVEKY